MMNILLSYWPILLWLAALITLLLSRASFKETTTRSNGKLIAMLMGITVLMLLVVGSLFGWLYYQAQKEDTSIMDVQKQVGFSILSPTYIPEGLVQQTKYYVDEPFASIGYSNQGVRVVYTKPVSPNILAKETAVPLLVIIQAESNTSFNLASYKETIEDSSGATNTSNFQAITLPGASSAYSSSNETIGLSSVMYTSSTGTVVFVNGLHLPMSEVLKVAQGMK